jgi:hypothetical protein
MLRRLGLAISYVITIGYLFLILMPSLYCFRHGCRGGGEGDAFMVSRNYFLDCLGW